MNIKDFLPMDPEIEQMHYDKKTEDSLSKLQYLEDGVRRSIKDLASSLKKSSEELENLLQIQQESERNYIQLVNRHSDLISKNDLAQIKQENKQIELRLSIQQNINNALLDLANNYKEYSKSLKELEKIIEKLNKKQSSWRDAAAELAKLRGSQMASGGKLNKVEKKIESKKADVIKIRTEIKHRQSFVETNLKHINETLLKLKNSIKNFV
ncbi:MAG: hypothetical protein K9W44_01505 [Candidatus Lokiarchaeota archaeon]|nr:hypothetical protein [Candidatus Harpocratesius repetitus]